MEEGAGLSPVINVRVSRASLLSLSPCQPQCWDSVDTGAVHATKCSVIETTVCLRLSTLGRTETRLRHDNLDAPIDFRMQYCSIIMELKGSACRNDAHHCWSWYVRARMKSGYTAHLKILDEVQLKATSIIMISFVANSVVIVCRALAPRAQWLNG